MQTYRLMWRIVLMVAIVAGVGWDIPQALAQRARVPQTGQTQCWDINWNPTTCEGTGEDGDYQAGVEWPTPRFTDRGNGTVRDNLTGLIWLKDTACKPCCSPWWDALTWANTLASGMCGLTDGSVAGDWRLPNIKELQSLVDFSQEYPALPADHPFRIVQLGAVWSSTTRESRFFGDNFRYAWTIDARDGIATIYHKTTEPQYVWPVRGGN